MLAKNKNFQKTDVTNIYFLWKFKKTWQFISIFFSNYEAEDLSIHLRPYLLKSVENDLRYLTSATFIGHILSWILCRNKIKKI